MRLGAREGVSVRAFKRAGLENLSILGALKFGVPVAVGERRERRDSCEE